jgi:hypothetical protein
LPDTLIAPSALGCDRLGEPVVLASIIHADWFLASGIC